jgi:hypothetical protein
LHGKTLRDTIDSAVKEVASAVHKLIHHRLLNREAVAKQRPFVQKEGLQVPGRLLVLQQGVGLKRERPLPMESAGTTFASNASARMYKSIAGPSQGGVNK